MNSQPLRVGVIGLGYWGPNLARNFDALPGAELRWICDKSEARRDAIATRFPHAQVATGLDQILADDACDAVAVATPVPTHADVACQVLSAGKHCFVEKPLAQTVTDAERMVSLADANQRTLMVGHLLEYHPGVERLKQLCDSGELGTIRYIYGNRLNLGKLRADENALWSLGAHDLSVLLRLVGEQPTECHAFGESYMRPGVEDVVFCFLRFPSRTTAHLHLSWLDPHKERRFTVVGSKRMATFDDMKAEHKLMIYDKGFDQTRDGLGDYVPRTGEAWNPKLLLEEPLQRECQHFIDSIDQGVQPRSDGAAGLRVVRVLEELDRSLRTRREVSAVRPAAVPPVATYSTYRT